MRQVEFSKTSNIFINTGIVALHRYLNRFQLSNKTFGKIRNELLPNKLIVENENLLNLLEEVYYFMGAEVYNTISLKQKEKMENVYLNEKTGEFHRFPKMNTYGLTELLTNNAQGTTRQKENSPKITELQKSKPDTAQKIRDYFETNGLKLLSKVYLNEPYTKVTYLKLESKYWVEGERKCPLIGEGFKSLVEGQNISPFIKGLSNFNSFLESSDKKVSQKALYTLRFSPAIAMFSYYKGYDSISASFFNSNNLVNINSLYSDEFFYAKDEMEGWKLPFQRNIKLENFKYSKKNNEDYTLKSGEDSYSPEEITFLLIYTFYKKKFKIDFEEPGKIEIDPFEDSPFEKIPISLVTFKADKFASTMRPNFYEEYSNFKFIIRLIHLLETNPQNNKKRIPIGELWRGLIFKSARSDAIKDFSKKMMIERKYRSDILAKLLKGRSILSDIESLFSKSYLILIKSKDNDPGRRRYDLLTELLTVYEPTINFGGINMDKSLQQRAINLGKSIGQGIINFESPKNDNEKKINAKNGRKYLISMHKARNIVQFREVLIRIQRKYSIAVANEIIENLNDSNYIAIKQYAQISALNTLNIVLSNQKSDS
ncbi:MAG: hypothetical protein AB7O48_11855 [Cyclobacteriaceae bacterium]